MIRYIAIFFLITSAASAQVVDIPDPNLRAAIERQLGKSAGDTITVADMETLTALDASVANISNLTGLGVATNLMHLLLWDNNISNISLLAGLTYLTDLHLGGNSISDISAVAGLTNLIGLGLEGNPISDISPLCALLEQNPELFLDIEIDCDPSTGHPPTQADINSDGVVNILDLVSVASEFGKAGTNLVADVNGDGIVNILDLVAVAGQFQ